MGPQEAKKLLNSKGPNHKDKERDYKMGKYFYEVQF